MKRLALVCYLLSASLWAQYLANQSVTLECREATWVSSTGPTAAHSADNCGGGSELSSSLPVAEADHIACGGLSGAYCVPGTFGTANNVPTNLAVVNGGGTQQNVQFRVTGIWPRTGYAKTVEIDTQVSPAAGAVDYTLSLCKTGVVTGGITCPSGGNHGGANLATDNGTTITVATGAATYIIQKAHFDLFHDIQVGTTHVVLASNHGANDGLVLFGPASGTACVTGGNADPTQCTTPYLSNADASSTASIEENGPLRAVILITGSFLNGATAYPNTHYTVREEFEQGKPGAKVWVALRDADNEATPTSKMFRAFEARITLNLASGSRAITIAGAPSGSGTGTTFATATTTLTSTLTSDQAYLYQAYSTVGETADWRNGTVSTGAGGTALDTSLAPYIARSNASTYAQNGWTMQSTQAITGTVSGDNTTAAGGWADVADTNGAGMEIGAYELTAYWPKSLGYFNGGSEARVGIWPDQTLWTAGCTGVFVDGTSTPCHNAYGIAWTHYQEHTLFFNPHAAALANAADSFLKFQHPLVLRATPGGATYPAGCTSNCVPGAGAFAYYNAAVDATSGLRALPVEIPDPVAEDGYYKTVPGFTCSTLAGTCIPDVGPTTSTSEGQGMKIFRFYLWNNSGGGNQHEFALADELLYLQRGLTGYLTFANNFYRMISETSSARSDFAGGWRGTAQALINSLGFPSANPANSKFATYNYIGRDGQHAHDYGYETHYFLAGDEDEKANLLSSFEDRFNNPNIPYDNPWSASSGSGQIYVTRTLGHFLFGVAQLSEFLRTVNDSTKDTIATPTVLQSGDYNLEFQSQDAPMSQTGASETCTWTTNFYVGATCPHGVNRKRGLPWMGTESETFHCDPVNYPAGCNEGTNPPGYGVPVRVTKPFMMGIMTAGIHQYALAAADLRGPTWTSGNPATGWAAGGGTVPAVNVNASLPAGTLFGDIFVRGLEYSVAESILQEDRIYASGVVTCSSTACGWVDGFNQIPSTIVGQSITVDGQSYTVSSQTSWNGTVNTSGTAVTWVSGTQFTNLVAGQSIEIGPSGNLHYYTVSAVNSATSLTLVTSAGTQTGATDVTSALVLNVAVTGGAVKNVPYYWAGFDTPGNCSPACSPNYKTSGLPYFVTQDLQTTTPPLCGSPVGATICTFNNSGGTGGRNCGPGSGSCGTLELEPVWAALGNYVGSVNDLSGNSWQCATNAGTAPCSNVSDPVLDFNTWANKVGPPIGPTGDQSHYIMWTAVTKILHASDSPAPGQLKDLTLTGGTCVAASNQCTITWTAPSDAVTHDGIAAILKYTADSTSVVNWLGFNNYNTTATYAQCALNAAPDSANSGSCPGASCYVSGCWGLDPAANSQFALANDVVTEPTLSSGTYTLTGLTNGTTYHFALKYYGNGSSAPTTFNLTVTLSISGAGTVTSSPAGINTSTGQTFAFNSGTGVTLSQTPNGSYSFTGYSGDCTGSTCSLTMSANHAVTANYAPIGLSPTGAVR